jgi:hypothetical protein
MLQQRDLPTVMGCGALLQGLLAGYRYLGRRLWPRASFRLAGDTTPGE